MEICNFFQYNRGMERQPRLRADRLKEEVERLPQTPGKLAEELGISYETLYKTLRGQIAQPPAETIAKIALKTGRSIEYFMDLTDSKSPAHLELTEMQLEIVKLLSSLPQFRQHDLLLIAQTWVANNEESTKRFFAEVKNLILSAVDAVGKGDLADRYMEIVNEYERAKKLPVSGTSHQDGNAEAGE